MVKPMTEDVLFLYFRYRCYYLMFLYLSYFHYVYKHNLIVCTDVIMQIMLFSEFIDLPHVHRCCGAGHYNPCLHRCYGVMMKGEGNIVKNTYRKVYPTGVSAPKFYGLPKIHKEDVPLRPIVSSIGSVTYGVAKELSRILKPLVGNSSHHVNNSKEFAEEIRNIKLERGECITSFDVTTLYTSMPVAEAIEVIKRRLEQDTELPRRTTWSPDNILKLLEFCLVNTYFLFDGQFFEQTKGAAMGSPVSPIVANIYMEAFEDRAINTALHPPKKWKRYVDDTFVIQLESQKEEFFHHINQVTHPSSSPWKKLDQMVPSHFLIC